MERSSFRKSLGSRLTALAIHNWYVLLVPVRQINENFFFFFFFSIYPTELFLGKINTWNQNTNTRRLHATISRAQDVFLQ